MIGSYLSAPHQTAEQEPGWDDPHPASCECERCIEEQADDED